MLVLSRHKNESVRIVIPDGRFIDVVLIELRGDKCRLGFEAPRDIGVHRLEVYEAIKAEGGSMTAIAEKTGGAP